MAYIQVEASVRTHRKFLRAGPAASWLWLCGIGYCQDNRTNGFIASSAIDRLEVPDARRLAAALVSEGLWELAVGGWRVSPGPFQYRPRRMGVRHLFERLAAWWGRACVYCSSTDTLEIEHIVPIARGGSDSIANLTLACRPCNQAKRTMTAAEFGHPEVHDRAAGIR